jgi:hypothetical protein
MDDELERIKRRRMLDLQRRMLQEEMAEEEPEKPAEPTPREILDGMFSGRAWEVYETAKAWWRGSNRGRSRTASTGRAYSPS